MGLKTRESKMQIRKLRIGGVNLSKDGITLSSAASFSTNTIAEVTAANGVTIDGSLIKDGTVPTRETVAAFATAGAITAKDGTALLTGASAITYTLANPTDVTDDGKTLRIVSNTAQAHKIDQSAGAGFNGGGGTVDFANFGGAIGDNIQLLAYGGRWLVLATRNVTIAGS